MPALGYWHSLLARHAKVWKGALKEASKAIETGIAGRAQAQAEPILVRNTPRQPVHPAARLRQQQSRWISTSTKRTFTTFVRHITSTTYHGARGVKHDRASLPKSIVGNAVNRSSGRAPFASALRPNLTGGSLGRTAGGYSLGAGRVGGARYFSHGPASQAQVVQNVSQAVRAFLVSGAGLQFNGLSPITGEKRYKAVTTLQEETGRKMRSLPKATPGSYIDFSVNPTITALTALQGVAGYSTVSIGHETEHLNTDGLLDLISVDFSRALKELTVVLNDLKRLSALGDLPITYHTSSLRIHFPGCDAETVERLCDELSLQRGVVVQDDDFDAFTGTDMALLFPFAPSRTPSEVDAYFEDSPPPAAARKEDIDWRHMLVPSEASEAYSTQSQTGLDVLEQEGGFTGLSSPSGYESLSYSSSRSDKDQQQHSPLEYQGFEGIYRFIEQCDASRRRR